MDIVHFLAELWGFSLVIVCLALLLRPKNIEHLFSLGQQPTTLLFIGVINIIFGVALVLTYNVWNPSWEVAITILGWLVIARGGLILFFPDKVSAVMEKAKTKMDWVSMALVVGVLIGCVLLYLGMTY